MISITVGNFCGMMENKSKLRLLEIEQEKRKKKKTTNQITGTNETIKPKQGYVLKQKKWHIKYGKYTKLMQIRLKH